MKDPEMQTVLARIGNKGVTFRSLYQALAPITEVFTDNWNSMNVKNAIRNGPLDAIEQRLVALEASPT